MPEPAEVDDKVALEWTRKNVERAPSHPLKALYRRNMERVRAQGGLPQVNHPNFDWSVEAKDLIGLEGPYLLEVWSAFDWANNLGGTTSDGERRPSAEALWDALLLTGAIVWASAADDSHYYKDFDRRGWQGRTAWHVLTPGKTWVRVRASSLNAGEIIAAMGRGEFYASNGIDFDDISFDGSTLALKVNQGHSPATSFTTRFVGGDGRVLATVEGTAPSYRLKKRDIYVRASVVDSDGRRAWSQPVFGDRRRAASPYDLRK